MTPNIAELVITTTDIDGDIGIVDRLHRLYPCSQLAFKLNGSASHAVNQIARKEYEIDILTCKLHGKFAQDDWINPVGAAAAVAGDDEFPGSLGRIC